MTETVRRMEFTALGRPQPGGSKRSFQAKTGQTIVKDDNPKAKPWQAVVAAAAREAMDGDGQLLTGPLFLSVAFYLARPGGHFGTGRNAGAVKDSAPRYPATRPDATKLLRALEDGLTGVAWRDDAQVVIQLARKRYGTPERADIIIEEL